MRARTPLVTAVVLSFSLTGCAAPPQATITATGRVVADSVTVQAPTLAVPAVSLDAGFVSTGATAPTRSKVPVLLSMGSGQRVSSVAVQLGDSVRAGDVLLRFDDDALAQQVRVAKADLAVAKAQVGVLDSAIDTTHDKEQDLVDKRADVNDGIAKGTKARRDLTGKLADARTAQQQLPKQLATVEQNLTRLKKQRTTLTAQLATVEKNLAALKKQRATLAEQLAQVDAALAALPPDAPPAVRDPLEEAQQRLTAALKQVDAGIAKLTNAQRALTAGLRQIDAGLGKLAAAQTKLKAAIEQVNTGIPKLTKAIATIDSNLAKARDGLKQITKGIDKIRDARADLKRARTLARIAAKNTTAVDGARNDLAQAVVKAPADGVVSGIVKPGDVVAPGATVVELDRPAHTVRVWLAPEEVARVCEGDSATAALDSLGALAAGSISRIVPLADYPPSHTTTGQVHLTRAVQVDLSFPTAMPPGVPADVQISPCRNSEVHA